MRKLMAIIPALALAGCAAYAGNDNGARAAREQARLDKVLAGYEAGEPRRCVDSRELQSPESYGDRTILFRGTTRSMWRSDVSGKCDRLGKFDALVTRTFGSQVCSGDIAYQVDTSAGFMTGSCSFGDFVPYRKRQAR